MLRLTPRPDPLTRIADGVVRLADAMERIASASSAAPSESVGPEKASPERITVPDWLERVRIQLGLASGQEIDAPWHMEANDATSWLNEQPENQALDDE